jgi:hypothetical protein
MLDWVWRWVIRVTFVDEIEEQSKALSVAVAKRFYTRKLLRPVEQTRMFVYSKTLLYVLYLPAYPESCGHAQIAFAATRWGERPFLRSFWVHCCSGFDA